MSTCSRSELRSRVRWTVPRWLALLPIAFANVGCVEHALTEALKIEEKIDYELLEPKEPSAGAIWRGETASGSFLYYDRKARGLGDLVTVQLVENLSAAGSANTTTNKSNSLGATLNSDIGLTGLVTEAAGFLLGLVGIDGVATPDPGTSVSVIEAANDSAFTGDGNTTRASTFSGTVTCRVMEVVPGGLLRIRGKRELIVNHELQLITVTGLVRRSDISIDNTVNSTQIANASLTYDGLGVLDDRQRPSLAGRVMDWLYPF